jgi:ribosome-binding protein aMBF1 (putative translation factor)
MGYHVDMSNETIITESRHPDAVADDAGADAVEDPLEEYLTRVKELREILALLPPEPSERLRLRRSLGLSRSELADAVGCAPATLKRLETEPGYIPRAVDVYVLTGLALFYGTAGYHPSA